MSVPMPSPMDPLQAGARALWEGLAAVPVSFPPAGGVSVVVSPASGLCPAGWVGVVSLCGAALVTAPTKRAADLVRDALATLPQDALTDADAVRAALPVARVLGPAALSYTSSDLFRPAAPGVLPVHRLPGGHSALRRLEEAAGADDTDEAALDDITSPAFVIRAGDAGGPVIAAAGYRSWPGRAAHLSVLTDPALRGRGLARVTASAAVTHALTAGLLPQWRARLPASRRVAAALGFRELGAQLSIRLRSAGAQRHPRP
ncbi:GNAT family N-acetyltransferase [Streptomyces sp. NPDC051133]|uniref:GNAT family N-acetyltransferase n=1 Tax=Streptomyces sp. NPDC051133 TaxID=3155521 RepID=UPI00342C73BD